MYTIIAILVVGILTAVVLLIRYILNALVDKGTDAIHNAIVEKKKKEKPAEKEYLADRYR